MSASHFRDCLEILNSGFYACSAGQSYSQSLKEKDSMDSYKRCMDATHKDYDNCSKMSQQRVKDEK